MDLLTILSITYPNTAPGIQLTAKAVQKNHTVGGAPCVKKGAITNPLSVAPRITVPTGSKSADVSLLVILYRTPTTKAPKGLPGKA